MRGIASTMVWAALLLTLGACGKYGPPRRAESKPASAPAAAPASPAAAPAVPAAPPDTVPDDEPLGTRAPETRQ